MLKKCLQRYSNYLNNDVSSSILRLRFLLENEPPGIQITLHYIVTTCAKYNNNHIIIIIYTCGGVGMVYCTLLYMCGNTCAAAAGGSEVILYFYGYRFRSFRLIFSIVCVVRVILLWPRRHCSEAQYTLIITAYNIVVDKCIRKTVRDGQKKHLAENIIFDPETTVLEYNIRFATKNENYIIL